MFPLKTGKRARLRIAVVGCGHIWRQVYRPILQSCVSEVEVVAVCDINAAAAVNAIEVFPSARSYTSIEKCLDLESPEAVLILTAESANASSAILALEAGASVYIEKPPALSQLEWSALRRAETRSRGTVFTAFNRRHTPKLHGWNSPKKLRKVRGTLRRQGRDFATFPFTAVHLIDSSQFFSGQSLLDVKMSFYEEEALGWRIQGSMSNGATCDLTFVPDGPTQDEYLIFESGHESREIHFPDVTDAANHLETTGYAPCFQAFLNSLSTSGASEHTLQNCGATVRILEQMRLNILNHSRTLAPYK